MPVSELLRDHDLWNLQGVDLKANADMSERTSMETRATAAVLARPSTARSLHSIVTMAREREWPLVVIGGGTNTIFATTHFEGIVVNLPADPFGRMDVVDDNIVRVGAGADLGGLLNFVRRSGLMGLEFCTMIPGTVGGALAGNAGAGNWGICDFVERALVMTRSGRVVEVRRGEFEFRYRHSELSEAIVLEADLRLESLDPELSRERAKEYISKKKGQPYKIASCGCIFKNPVDPKSGKKVSAGMLIDQAGLKGYSLNGAKVSEDHANFIVNAGGASGEDFLAMISLVRDIVAERFGIQLDVEARIVGGPLSSCVME